MNTLAMKLTLGFCIALANVGQAASIVSPQCEYRTDPLGIDIARPRLSWVITAGARSEHQLAYRILVASSLEKLAGDQADRWDSGKVSSDQTLGVEYAGPALESGQSCYWKVQVWTSEAADAMVTSEPALWTMGLLQPADWSAKWIGYDVPPNSTAEVAEVAANKSRLSTAGLKWIRLPAAYTGDATHFTANITVTLPEGPQLRRAVLVLYADNQCSAIINTKPVGVANRWDETAHLDVTSVVHPGDNQVSIAVTNSDQLFAAVVGKLVFQFENSPDETVTIDKNWLINPAANGVVANGAAAMIPPEEMKDTPWGTPALNDAPRPPAPYLRKKFSVDKPVRRATIYATALGLYELHLNGQKVGNDVLTPGWTEYRKRVYYQTYDVTKQVTSGENVIGALLGEGWYSGSLAFTGKHDFYGGNPRFMGQLVIEFTDGTTQTVGTDETWKAAYGSVRYGDLLLGSEIDTRLAISGWDAAGFDDQKWAPVVADLGKLGHTVDGSDHQPLKIIHAEYGQMPSTDGPLVEAAVTEASREFEELPAIKLTEPQPGLYTFDLGQNMVGWARLHAHGIAGQRITVRHGEMLNPDGTIYTANLRGATAADFYILDGTNQLLEPKFTFHGFRYVEIRGLDAKPELDAVTGIVVHSDITRSGQFECSSPLINQLYHNIIWGQKGNYLEVPTDCPQRDERAGWTGDTQFFAKTAAYNYNVDPFFTRWLTTICEDSQHEDGSIANVAPDLGIGSGSTAWGDSALLCAYRMYQSYDDTRVITAHFAAMDRYMQFIASKSRDFVPDIGGFGDWLNLGGGASKKVIDTAYYAHLADIMSQMATAIGRTDDAARYAKLHEDVKAAFAKFFKPDGSITDSSQTGFALAFTMNLVPDELREKTIEKYADEVKRFDWHLATGFIGTPRLLPGLHAAGRDDVAYRVLLQETYPSWLFQVKLGATTMWERWDGWTPDRGFQTIGMNSFNHYAFGAVGEYLYGVVGGITPESPGYKTIRIAPVPGEGITWAKTTYNSVHGPIACNWKQDGDHLTMEVTVPANTTATVVVPTDDPTTVTESDKPATESPGVKAMKPMPHTAEFEVQSGRYSFASSYKM